MEKVLGVNQMFFCRCKKRVEDKVGSLRHLGSGSPCTVRTHGIINEVSSKICCNPTTSTNKMAKESSVSSNTMQDVIKKDFHLQPFKLKKCQLLPEATRKKGLSQSKILNKWLTDNPHVVLIGSDEMRMCRENLTTKMIMCFVRTFLGLILVPGMSRGPRNLKQ